MTKRIFLTCVLLSCVLLTSCTQRESDFTPSPVIESVDGDFFDTVADSIEKGVSNSGSSGGVGGHEPNSVVDKGTYRIIGSKEFPVELFLEKLKSNATVEIEKHSVSASRLDTKVDEKVIGFHLSWKTRLNQGVMDFVYLGRTAVEEERIFRGFENLNTIYTFRYLKIEYLR